VSSKRRGRTEREEKMTKHGTHPNDPTTAGEATDPNPKKAWMARVKVRVSRGGGGEEEGRREMSCLDRYLVVVVVVVIVVVVVVVVVVEHTHVSTCHHHHHHHLPYQ